MTEDADRERGEVVASAGAVREDVGTPGVDADGHGTQRCPRCGVDNDARRQLCGACGIDLETGDPQLTVAPAAAEAGPIGSGHPPADDGRPRAVSWWIPALAGLAAVVALAGAMIGLGLGPFATGIDRSPADFVVASYPGEAGPLAVRDVETVTHRRPVADRRFTPEHLVDGDPATAWHGEAGALPPGAIETIDLFLERPAWISAVVIGNGDHRDADAYAETARVQRAVVIFDGDVRIPVTLLDLGPTPQIVELEEPMLSRAVRIEIEETVAGTDLQQVAITRLELLGFTASGDDVVVAEQRAELFPAAGAVGPPAGRNG